MKAKVKKAANQQNLKGQLLKDVYTTIGEEIKVLHSKRMKTRKDHCVLFKRDSQLGKKQR